MPARVVAALMALTLGAVALVAQGRTTLDIYVIDVEGELFGEQGVMNLAGLIGYYNFVNITLKTFDVQLAPGRERLLPLP